MTRTVSVREAEAQFGQLLLEVEAGEEDIITRRGEPVARLTPIENKGKRPLGFDKGLVIVSENFDAPLPD